MEKKKYYIAYGSNLHLKAMAGRCPDAKVVGTGVLEGWQLLFKGCATIEECPGKNTPVAVWEISERDEKRLDVYEGFPGFYYKQDLALEVIPKGGEPLTVTAMVYIMNEEHYCHAPSAAYYKVLEDGYRDFRFPLHVLRQALTDSVGGAETRLFLERGGFDRGRR